MQNNFDEETSKDDINLNLKSLNNKIMIMSGYIIAMRSESIRESKKTEEALKALVKQTYDIRGGTWVCLLTIWFLTILIIQRELY